MHKRGQLALIIIFGIVFLITIALILTTRAPHPVLPVQPSVFAEAKGSYDACAEQSVRLALDLLLSQGGRFAPADYAIVPPFLIAIAADKEGIYLPDQADLEEELSLALPIILQDCVSRAGTLANDRGAILIAQDLEAVAVFTTDGLIVRLTSPASIIVNDVTREIEGKVITIKTNALALRDAAALVAESSYPSGAVPIAAITRMGFGANVVHPYGGIEVVSITDDNEVFNVALRPMYAPKIPLGPRLRLPETILLRKDAMQDVPLAVDNPEGLALDWSVDLLWMSFDDGTLVVDTTGLDAGDYLGRITVSDGNQRFDEAVVRFIVP